MELEQVKQSFRFFGSLVNLSGWFSEIPTSGEEKSEMTTDNGQDVSSLWVTYKTTNDKLARDHLILAFTPMVKRLAERLAMTLPSYVDGDDLLSYGIEGLVKAMERFALERGVPFEAYAVRRIKGAMLDGLRSLDWVPPHVRRRVRELEGAYVTLEERLGRTPTSSEVAEHLGLTADGFHTRLREMAASNCLLSLDDFPMGGDNPEWTGLNLPDESNPQPDVQVEMEEVRQVVAQAVHTLPEKERLVVNLYYYRGLTSTQIAQMIGVSQSRVSQIHKKALTDLKKHLQRRRIAV